MIKKVLLVSTNFEEIDYQSSSARLNKGSKTAEESHYPLSLAYLHAVLEKNEYETKSLFLNSHSNEECHNEVISVIKEFKPEVVGFQVLTNNRVSSFRLMESIHQQFPDIKIIIGGIHATILCEQIIDKFPFAIAVLGEGEITIIELLKEFSGANSFNRVDGIAYFDQNAKKVIKTNPRKMIEDLDSLPWPKHEIFFNNARRGTACILTARGCPFNCSFCCLDTISNRRVRFRSINNVVDEIEWLLNKFPQIGKIWIQDDTFFVNNARVIEFCDEIKKRKLRKVGYICVARVKPISQEMVDKLVETNFIRVFLGLESADTEILKKCHKGIIQEDVVRAVQMFAETDIVVRIFLIVGLPGETIDTVKTTINFTKKLQKIKYLHFGEAFPILAVFPGTEVYQIAKAGGMINDDYWLSDKPTPPFTLEHSFDELTAYKELMLNHLSLGRAFSSWAGFKAQFTMLPRIIPYIIKNRLIIATLSTVAFSLLSEKNFLLVKKIFNTIRKRK